MSETVKRNSERRTGKAPTALAATISGVGGRQGKSPPPVEGGGYQNVCAVLNFGKNAAQKKRDPRLDELRQMGLQRVWLDGAEAIGVDNLLKLWRIIDSDSASIGDNGRLIPPICRYSTFLRYQRNRYIETLDGLGLSPSEIREKLSNQLCEEISLGHIYKIIRRE